MCARKVPQLCRAECSLGTAVLCAGGQLVCGAWGKAFQWNDEQLHPSCPPEGVAEASASTAVPVGDMGDASSALVTGFSVTGGRQYKWDVPAWLETTWKSSAAFNLHVAYCLALCLTAASSSSCLMMWDAEPATSLCL